VSISGPSLRPRSAVNSRSRLGSVQAAEEPLLETRREFELGPGHKLTGSPDLVASMKLALKMYVRLPTPMNAKAGSE
jgi:hypothetical protein